MIITAIAFALAAAPAAGTATGSLGVAGKSVPVAHAAAFNAGARIYVLITDKALPPDKVKSEFEMAIYQFENKVSGLELVLDSDRKVTEVAYRWDLTRKACPGCFDVTVTGGPSGPLTGTIKSTAKGEAAEKLKVDVTFSAPFVKASAAKP
jgi:hypothetical protein